MQMSAGLCRNAVCGPGCAEMIGLGVSDIYHTPGAEALWPPSPGNELPAASPGAPAPGARVQREDDRWDVARLGRGEQIAAHRRVGLGHTAIELVAKALAQGLRGATDDPGDFVLAHADPSQVAHLLAHCLIDDECCSSHCRILRD